VTGSVVGREHELAEANGFLADVAERTSGLLIVGEAGIGKTTIWSSALAEAVRRGYTVLKTAPSEAEVELPFAALIDVFAQVDAAIIDGLPPAQRDALEQALRRTTSSAPVDPTAVALATLGVLRALADVSPTLLAIDDLQWVDPPSLRAFIFALRRLEREPVGVLATIRSGFDTELAGGGGRGPAWLGRIEVVGLGRRHLAQLVRQRAGRTLSPTQLARFAELSRGNPLHALQLAAAGGVEPGVPETLAVVLRARLTALSSEAKAAGLAAGLLGQADEAVLGRLYGSGLAELRLAEVVAARDGVLRFAHPVLASTIVDMHTAAERRRAHLQLAGELNDPDERALHLAHGTDTPSEAVACELDEAAYRVDARGAPETAAVLAEQAAALTPATDTAARTRRLIRAADLWSAAGEGRAHVIPLLEKLETTLPPGPDHARVLVRLAWVGAQLDTMTSFESIDCLQRALDEAGDTPDVGVAAQAALARLVGISGDYLSAFDHAERAVAAGEVTAANLMFPAPSGELGAATFFSGQGLDERLFEHGIAVEAQFDRSGEPYQSTKLQFALALLHTGQLARARDVLHELLARSIDLGRVSSASGCVLHLIETEVRAGRMREAEAHAAEFVHLDRQLRGDASGEWYPSGLVAVHLGQVEDARRILEGGIEQTRSVGATRWLAKQLGALGHLELALGNLDEARALLVPLPELLRGTGLGEWSVHPVHPDAIETLVGLGELDEASELTAELEEYGRRLDRPWGLATAARSAALIAAARGANGEALDAAERALREHERLEWPFERARTLLVSGTILRRLGRRREAAAALDQASSLFASLRSPLWLARATAEMQRLGGRRAVRGTLTPTEQRVAELAADGLRNAEIAAALFVTPKTVEATLSRVYRKLGVRSRTELTRNLSRVAKTG
jgi:DNA-binding CsgD family transcriptional regulator